MTAKIPVGLRGIVALVDEADFEVLSQYKWTSIHTPHTTYTRGKIDGQNILMHRFIMKPKPGVFIDHIDRNGLNNQRSNLRFATNAQNGANRRFEQKNGSGYIGVRCSSESSRGRLYRGFVTVNRRVIRTPSFERADEAAIERDKLALIHHGEFAVLNFPELVGR